MTNAHNVICLPCRRSGAGLRCAHRKVYCRAARAPRLAAGRSAWLAFVTWLNARVSEGGVIWTDDGSRVTERLTL
jgi:hypothetical protein